MTLPVCKKVVLIEMLEHKIPFNHLLGLKVTEMGDGYATVRMNFQKQWVGNFAQNILHGGIIASVLDVVGAAAAMSTFSPKSPLYGIGTVDMRIDYLLPAQGEYFVGCGTVVRPGRTLISTRMEFLSSEKTILATGAAIYRVSRKEANNNMITS